MAAVPSPSPGVSPQASPCPKEANRALLNDNSCWTIIGTESVEFSFSTSLACTREPVTPVPLISTLEVNPGAAGRWRAWILTALGGAGVQVKESCELLASPPRPPLLPHPLVSPSPS